MSTTEQAWAHHLRKPLLTPEHERELLDRAAVGDRAAHEELVARNLRLVLSRAQRYRHILPAHLSFDDLLQHGAIALSRAIDRFDPSVGAKKLSTLATAYIDNELKKVLADNAHTLSMQRNVGSVYRMSMSDPTITVEAFAERAKISTDAARNVLQARHRVWLDAPCASSTHDANPRTNAEVYSAADAGDDVADDICTKAAAHDQVAHLLQPLSPRERRFLTLRFGLDGSSPASCDQLAEEFNMPVENVPRLEATILERARQHS